MELLPGNAGDGTDDWKVNAVCKSHAHWHDRLGRQVASSLVRMVHTLQQKKAATVILKSLDLPADLRAKALACAASDSTAGHSLRDLVQLNDDDDLKPAIISFLEGQVAGKVVCGSQLDCC